MALFDMPASSTDAYGECVAEALHSLQSARGHNAYYMSVVSEETFMRRVLRGTYHATRLMPLLAYVGA